MDIRQVAITGLAVMGAGIAEVFARGRLRAMHAASGDPASAPVPLLADRAAAGLAFRG